MSLMKSLELKKLKISNKVIKKNLRKSKKHLLVSKLLLIINKNQKYLSDISTKSPNELKPYIKC